MFIRASTQEQDAKRAKNELIAFAQELGRKVATLYIENESGATLVCTELMQLMQLIAIIAKKAK